jgi:hypothetical protein
MPSPRKDPAQSGTQKTGINQSTGAEVKGSEDPVTAIAESLKLVSLRSLIIPIIDDMSKIGQVSKKELKPFEINISEKLVGLPDNYIDLIKKSYLYAAFFAIMQSEGYEGVPVKTFNSKFKPDGRVEAILQGFCVPIFSKRVPKFEDKTNVHWKGLRSSLHQKYIHDKAIKVQFFKFRKEEPIARYVLGDAWGKDYPAEKKILDWIVSFARTQKWDESELKTWMISTEEIEREMGLRLDLHKTSLFNSSEKSLIDSYLKNIRSVWAEEDKNDFESLAMSQIPEFLQKRQKSLREYRSVIKDLIDKRMSAVFSPYETKKDKAKSKKTPIKELISNVEGTLEWRIAFNPSAICSLLGVKITLSPRELPVLKGSLDRAFEVIHAAEANGSLDKESLAIIENVLLEYSTICFSDTN